MQKTFVRDSHLQVCLLRHNARRHNDEARATYWDVMESVQNPKINWKESSRVRIGGIAFTAEASNL